MTPRLLTRLLLGMACLMSAACDEKLSTLAGPTPTLEPTFASIQNDIFQTTDSSGRTRCLQCHTSTGRNPAGGLNLNPEGAYEQLVNAASVGKPGAIRVIPGNPDASYLIQKLEGAAGIVGRRMPTTGPPFLTDGQIKIVRRWIAIGAPR
jgi:mono/diheme cytochrome c family protein